MMKILKETLRRIGKIRKRIGWGNYILGLLICGLISGLFQWYLFRLLAFFYSKVPISANILIRIFGIFIYWRLIYLRFYEYAIKKTKKKFMNRQPKKEINIYYDTQKGKYVFD